MKRLSIILVLVLAFSGCKEEIEYEERILIRNSTSVAVEVELIPNMAYRKGFGYKPSSKGSGIRDLKFLVGIGEDAEIFVSDELTGRPHELAMTVLEGMILTLESNEQTTIEFTHDSALKYTTNFFSEDANWIYEKHDSSRPTQFERNPVESHNYYFVISEENLK